MSLISCPECGGKLSTAAEACPHCGHPADLITRPQKRNVPAQPKCYACERMATTRCQKCGKLSCAVHLTNVRVRHNYELRCKSCYQSVQSARLISVVILLIIFAIAITLVAMNLFPGPPFGHGL
jgi:hypothetical protein